MASRDLTLIDTLDPAVLEAVIEAASVPFTTNAIVAEKTKLPIEEVARIVPVLKDRGLLSGLRKAKLADLQELIDDRALRALVSMSDEDYEAASLKDKAIVTGILLEKRQLLRGEPTAILSIEERTALNRLVLMLVKEGERRGLAIDVRQAENGPMVDVTPPSQERATRPRTGAGKSWKEQEVEKDIKAFEDVGEPHE